ncbi:hypothetical protein M8I35_15360 [Micromonospora sp. MSM11]|nr:hypothetical protein [Micromonospora sp. MSM11]MCL7458557.1 hypothetical protein [Micromonospora sp. MSM11]
MTGPARDVAELVAALLRALPAADLAALAEGRARLAVVPVDATPPATPADLLAPAGNPATDGTTPATALPDRTTPATASADRISRAGRPGTTAAAPARRAAPAPEPAEARAALAAMARRDDGTAYLSGWTARDLRVLAASLELRGVAGLRKADLVGRIVDRTIGYRLDSAAIRRL